MRIRRSLVSSVALLLVLAGCGQSTGTYFAPTAAVVNGFKIPEEEVSEQLRERLRDPENMKLVKGPDGVKNRLEAYRQILSDLIQRQVLFQAAAELGVEVAPSEVEAQLGRVKESFSTPTAFQTELGRLFLTPKLARDVIRVQIYAQKVQAEVGKTIVATEEQKRQFFEQNKPEFDAQIRVAHILVCANPLPSRVCQATPEDEAKAKALAARAKSGEDFAALAEANSDDSETAPRGGELGWTSRGQFATTFEEVAFSLKPGETSEPVVSQLGWHVVKVLDVQRSYEEALEEIEGNLVEERRQAAFQDWFTSALKEAAPRIRVNPKFGRFDSSALQVVASGTPARA